MRPHARTLLLLGATAAAGCQVGSLAPANNTQCLGQTPLAADVDEALAALPSAHVALRREGDSSARFVRGYLGLAHAQNESGTALIDSSRELTSVARVFRARSGDLSLQRREVDELGSTHAFYEQRVNGLRVIGGELGVHVNRAGVIYAAHGQARAAQLPAATPTVTDAALPGLLHTLIGEAEVDASELAYFVDEHSGATRLVWEAHVNRDDAERGEYVVVDALSGEVIERRPMVHSLLNRQIYDMKNNPDLNALPGQLVMSEGGAASPDPTVVQLYAELAEGYNCFSGLLGRDSWDGLGRALVASVHVDVQYNNAFFTDQLGQLAFGDGDGRLFGNLATSADVIVHELAHGITSSSANLEYVNESGALNEAMSDIFAAACQARRAGQVSAETWLVGEDVFTPAVADDALRYMANPTLDEISTDFYPERFVVPQGQAPSRDNDFGGVHINSGIANLAFQLLVDGGSHPRARTFAPVARPLSMEQSAKIFYRALTTYLNPRSNFEAARVATAQAALDLYGAHAAASVHQAWDAVGIPGNSGLTPLLPPLEPNVLPLVRNTAQTNLASDAGQALIYAIEVPQGATSLQISTTGGTGDSDLYVRAAQLPSSTEFDHAPLVDGNEEVIEIAAPTAGTYYIALHGFSAFAGLTLQANFLVPGETVADVCN